MLVQTHFPHKLSARRYDQFLASGWFRGSVMLYKMDVLCMENNLFSVMNIRLNLDKHEPSKSLRKIKRKCEANFKVVIENVRITKEKEALYHQHKSRFKGFVHNSLREFLYSGMPTTVFNTKEVCVYHNEKLIACSYFDTGEKSVASLLGLYDLNYTSFSLGLFTMIKEAEYAKSEGYKWYYPGYILNESNQFHYKLRLGNFEYYNLNKRWATYSNFKKVSTPAEVLMSKTEEISALLTKAGVVVQRKMYPFFGIGYIQMWDVSFLKAPLVLIVEPNRSELSMLILSYDLDEELYILNLCTEAIGYDHLVQNNQSDSMQKDNLNFQKLIRVQYPLIQTENAQTICKLTLETLKDDFL